jgi:hypothetical protein
MSQKLIEIVYKQGESPFNTKLTLDLNSLMVLMPLIQSEILTGLANCQGEEFVVLNLNLDKKKYREVWSLLNSIEADHRKIA